MCFIVTSLKYFLICTVTFSIKFSEMLKTVKNIA